jgi:hypothetical protein
MTTKAQSAVNEREQYLLKLAELLSAWRKSIYSVEHSALEEVVGHDLLPKLLGRLMVLVVENPLHAGQLNQIYSETTPNERRFLYNFFLSLWAGQKNVLEIGPFLGGTTRAIALGMASNPLRQPDSKLYTYDKFADYYKGEQFSSLVDSLVKDKLLNEQAAEELRRSTCFRDIFTALHQGHDYYGLIELNERALPETLQQVSFLENIFTLDGGLGFDAVFVDGCKSWYSTKYFMREAAKASEPGTYFIFQDYGWYTCFWIPVFLAVMRESFRLVAYVDNTYAFQLVRPLETDEMEERYPDSPQDLGEAFFNALFNYLSVQAAARDDCYAQFVHSLHHAGCMAYLGDLKGAKAKLTALARRPYPPGYKELIQRSLKSPTYTPDGPIYL